MTRVVTWRDLRARAETALRAAAVPEPATEARWMVERVSGYDPAELVAAEPEPATARAAAHLDDLVARRAAGEPLQYTIGRWSFRGVELFVDRRVLIPRPETEIVAEVAIEELVALGVHRGRAGPWEASVTSYVVADLGTGSGALALALASELPEAEVWATDVSEDALAVARANVAGAGSLGTRVRLAAGSWFDALPHELRGVLRLVVSNPPYVAESEEAELAAEVISYEPRHALISGRTGLEHLTTIVREAPDWLEPRGVLVCELAPHQAGAVVELARRAGFSEVLVRADLAGRDRVLVARRG